MYYKVIGLMSGTSLDGLDIAYCHFYYDDNKWSYSIIDATTIPYSIEWKERLIFAEASSSEEFSKTDIMFGHYIGEQVKAFIDSRKIEVDFISSHGQTIFHQPESNFTTQIGDINAIAAKTNIKTIGDFRRLDVALGGQGAPLVPIGDKLLFSEFPYCLNLGGFSNISFDKQGERIAYDICPVNIVLNYLSLREGFEYDKDGMLAREGEIDFKLLETLNNLEYYKIRDKKSLGKEWVIKNILPLFDNNFSYLNNKDLLSTYTEHIAKQLSLNIKGDVLVTGGGAFNKFLIEKIRSKVNYNVFIPQTKTINYKEALIFAFLGVLRDRGENNCLCSVTGAMRDSSSGLIANG